MELYDDYIWIIVQFKAPPKIFFLACLISFCENSNLSSIHYNMLARLCNFCM